MYLIFKMLLLFFLFLEVRLFGEKVLIFTYNYNRPDFIEIQDRTFKKFLKDDYEFVVFNDASNQEMCDKINQTCDQLNIRCMRIPQEIHDWPYLKRWDHETSWQHPSIRNSNVVQYSLNTLGFQHPGIVVLLDSDIFLIKDFSIRQFLEGFDVAAIPQIKGQEPNIINYFWIGIVFLNMTTMPNKDTIDFNCGRIEDVFVDAGGQTYHYLTHNPSVRLKNIHHFHSSFFLCDTCRQLNIETCIHNTETLKFYGFNENEIKFLHAGPTNCEFIHNRTFFHYRGGTNWDNRSQEYHQKKTNNLNEFINDLCADS
jgi:hypothetical protein